MARCFGWFFFFHPSGDSSITHTSTTLTNMPLPSHIIYCMYVFKTVSINLLTQMTWLCLKPVMFLLIILLKFVMHFVCFCKFHLCDMKSYFNRFSSVVKGVCFTVLWFTVPGVKHYSSCCRQLLLDFLSSIIKEALLKVSDWAQINN